MKSIVLTLIFCGLLGYSQKALGSTALPEPFVNHAWSLIKASHKLEEATSNGINLTDFKSLYNEFSSELSLMREMWPKDVPKSNLDDLAEANMYWKGAIIVWNAKEGIEAERLQAALIIYSIAAMKYPDAHLSPDDGKNTDLMIKNLLGIGRKVSEKGRSSLSTVLNGEK